MFQLAYQLEAKAGGWLVKGQPGKHTEVTLLEHMVEALSSIPSTTQKINSHPPKC